MGRRPGRARARCLGRRAVRHRAHRPHLAAAGARRAGRAVGGCRPAEWRARSREARAPRTGLRRAGGDGLPGPARAVRRPGRGRSRAGGRRRRRGVPVARRARPVAHATRISPARAASARAPGPRAGEILVACAGGELVLLDPSGAVLALGAGPAEPLALAPGPRAGEWWLLDGHPAGLGLLGPQLATRWSVRTQLAATSLAPVPGRERVWLAAGASAQLFGAGGALELALELAGGPWCAASATDEGVRLLGIGAVLELETWGNQARIARTQGGFEGLASPAGEVSVPAAATPPPAGSSRRSRPRAPSRSAGSAPRAPRPRRVARAPPRARAPRTGGCARSRSRAPAGT